MTFGALLRARRNEQGLSLEDVALRAGLSVPKLSRIERDRDSPPSEETIQKLAQILGISANDLLARATQIPEGVTEQPSPVFAAYRRLGGGR